MSTMGRLRFCPSGKLAYVSKAHANEAARRQLRQFGYFRPYQCPDCGWWHLTKRPFRPWSNLTRRPS